MYNSEIKNKYLDYIVQHYSKTVAKNVSIRIENFSKIEQQYGCDLYYIPYNELADIILEQYDIYAFRTYDEYLRQIKNYKDWIMTNGIFTDYNPVMFLNRKDLHDKFQNHIQNVIIKSWNRYHKIIDNIFSNSKDSNYMLQVDFVKIFLLLLYTGIYKDYIFELKLDNIKFMNNGIFIDFNNNLIEIEDLELKQLLLKRKNCHQYEMNRGTRYEYVELSDYIISFSTTANDKNNMHNTTQKTYQYLSDYNNRAKEDIKLDYFIIFACGVIRKIKIQEETSKQNIKIKELYQTFCNVAPEKKIMNRNKKKTIKEIYKSW